MDSAQGLDLKPSQIDVDGARNLFLADRFNHIIRKIKPSADPMKASVVQTYAGTPMQGGRMNGPANIAQFYEPWGLAIRNSGLIFIGDTGNSRVAVIGPFRDIWSAFVKRINAARLAEYQTLSADYADNYRADSKYSRPREGDGL